MFAIHYLYIHSKLPHHIFITFVVGGHHDYIPLHTVTPIVFPPSKHCSTMTTIGMMTTKVAMYQITRMTMTKNFSADDNKDNMAVVVVAEDDALCHHAIDAAKSIALLTRFRLFQRILIINNVSQ
jgi:hypothetical protein